MDLVARSARDRVRSSIDQTLRLNAPYSAPAVARRAGAAGELITVESPNTETDEVSCHQERLVERPDGPSLAIPPCPLRG